MSGPTSNPDRDRRSSSAYGTFLPQRLSPIQSYDSTAVQSNGRDISPSSRPSPSTRKSSGHIEFRKYLKRPRITENQRTLSDALRSARSREEQETLLPDDDHAGSDGCFNGAGEPVGVRELFAPYPHANLTVYYNIHRCVHDRSLGAIQVLTRHQDTKTGSGGDRRSVYSRAIERAANECSDRQATC